MGFALLFVDNNSSSIDIDLDKPLYNSLIKLSPLATIVPLPQ